MQVKNEIKKSFSERPGDYSMRLWLHLVVKEIRT